MRGDARGRAPDFVGIGTHLAGTEWWLRMLAKHPQISHPRAWRKKGALYFFEPFCKYEMTEKDIATYHAYFRPRPGTIAGEWSNRYIYDVWTLPLIQRAAPDAKILILLRDPVELYRRSLGYRRGKRLTWRTGRRERDDPIYMTEEVHRCRYASQLRALHRFFAPEQILVLQMEACLADPPAEYRRTLRFLGVPETFVPRQLHREPRRDDSPVEHARLLRPFGLPKQYNIQPLRRLAGLPVPVAVELWADIRASLMAELTEETVDLKALLPELDLSLWPSFAHLA